VEEGGIRVATIHSEGADEGENGSNLDRDQSQHFAVDVCADGAEGAAGGRGVGQEKAKIAKKPFWKWRMV
jgi:hypothetical protein